MGRLDLSTLSTADLSLVQRGLAAVGLYHGTFRGLGGPKTSEAYERYLASLEPAPNDAAALSRPSLGEKLVEILLTKVGVREIPANSNRGPDVEEFQRATWLAGTGWPWCAAFVCWGMRELEKLQDFPFQRPRTAAAWGFEEWAIQQGLELFKPPVTIKKGDIVMFTFSHIGVAIADEQNGFVDTVEGNTDSSGSREGGGVYKKTRAAHLIRSHVRLKKKD